MYGKIFASIYDGTLRADWKALITFQQMIVLCDQNGVVDMTAHALHGRTGIPLDIIEHGIQKLEQPDPYSRSTEHEGRRILRLEDHRAWGWRIVNYGYYRTLASAEEKRNRDKERIANNRKERKSDMSQPVAECSNVSQPVADVAQVEVEAEVKAERNIVGQMPNPSSPEERKNGKTSEALEVLQFLNEKTGRKYRGVDGNGKPTANLKLIIERLKTGVSVQDCFSLIARKYSDWAKDDKMWPYLRPSTLFRASNFEQYLGECTTEENRNG